MFYISNLTTTFTIAMQPSLPVTLRYSKINLNNSNRPSFVLSKLNRQLKNAQSRMIHKIPSSFYSVTLSHQYWLFLTFSFFQFVDKICSKPQSQFSLLFKVRLAPPSKNTTRARSVSQMLSGKLVSVRIVRHFFVRCVLEHGWNEIKIALSVNKISKKEKYHGAWDWN